MKRTKTLIIAAALAAPLAAGTIATATDNEPAGEHRSTADVASFADLQPVTQHATLNWHPQSGNEGPVGADAVATLVRTGDGVRYRIDTSGLEPGHAYTVWFVVVNDPAACNDSPCAPPQIVGDPAVDGQVVWGRDGEVGRQDGTARFRARIAAGPLLDGWLPVQGLDDPVGAEIHLALNDHGPVIDELRDEMLSTYRAGCSDDSPFPDFFPQAALDDGTPGPNTCRLYQSAVFTPPA